jgi:hypothetical protein
MAFDKEWKPNPKQEIFLSLPNSIREAMLGGGAGTGKTDILLVYPLVRGWNENPRFKQVFMRRTFPELRNEIIPRSRQLYTKFGATLNKGDMAWTFPAPDQYGGTGMTNAGAMVFLGQCEDEEDVHKYDSMEINLYTPDELTSYTNWIYLYIGFTRVRTSDPTLPAIIRAAAMSGGTGHTWVKKRFVDPYPKGGVRIRGKGGNQRIYIHTTLEDNKEHIDPGYRQSLEGLPEAEKRAKLYGDWDAYSGQVFDEFRDRLYPDEPENAVHVIDGFDIPEWWPKIVIGDWGYRAMTWIGFAAISPDRRLYIYREMHWTRVKIELWAPYVKYFTDVENPRIVQFCKSAGHDRGQEHTIQQQLSDALEREIELTDNAPGSRVAGKQLIHEYLRWNQKPVLAKPNPESYSDEHAMKLYRNQGEGAYRSYIESFDEQEPETNLPKLQIFRDCPVLIAAIKACSYDKKKVEDIAQWDGDDPIDALRYIVDAAERYFEEAADEFAIIQKREILLKRVKENNDWTGFYRQARSLEAEEKIESVPMFNHRRRLH